jgi:hypothetical protein
MGLNKVHFKPNLHIFPYLETEIMTSSFFFFQKHTYILAYLKRVNFSEQMLERKNLLSFLNRDDCEFLIILFFLQIC